MQNFTLQSTNAVKARSEAGRRWPDKQVKVYGYDAENACVYMTIVRKREDVSSPVATANRSRKGPAIKFVAVFD